MAKPTIANLYNPKNLDKTTLIKSFVVRLQQFQDLFEDLKQGDWIYPQDHIMIEAQRGMGKTTLLWRLKYEIEQDENLQSWLLPVVFNEEEYSIRNLASIWELVVEILEQYTGFEGLVEEMETLYEGDDIVFERAIFKLLIQRLQTAEKKILLVIENFGDVLKKFSKQEVQRLRTILQSCADLRLIVASPIVLESFFKYDHSFYSFFRKVSLQGLNAQETKDLLLQLGELYQEKEAVERVLETQQGKVEALRRLTGGIIRTIVLLFEIFVDDVQGTAFRDLEKIADRVTPFYKSRIDDLPKNQQLIVDLMGKNWDAISVKELVLKTRLASKVISAQLNQLVNNGWVTKILTPTKNKLYYIRERFFNIWFLMRVSRRGDKKRVLWLTRFYEIFCTKQELTDRIQKFMSNLQHGNKDVEVFFLKGIAMSETFLIDENVKKDLVKTLHNYAIKHDKHLLKYFSKEEINSILSNNKSFQRIIDLLEQKLDVQQGNRKDGFLHKLTKNIKIWWYNSWALLKQQDKDYNQAEHYFLKSEKLNNGHVLFHLAELYRNHYKAYEKAVEYYLKGLVYPYQEKDKYLKHFCLNNLGKMCQNQLKEYEKAEEYYLQAVELGNKLSIYNLGGLFYELKNYKKAKDWYIKCSNTKYDDKDIKRICFENLGFIWQVHFLNHKEAEKCYLQAIKLGSISVIDSLADLYNYNLYNYSEAIKWYLNIPEYKQRHEILNNLGLAYSNFPDSYYKAIVS